MSQQGEPRIPGSGSGAPPEKDPFDVVLDDDFVRSAPAREPSGRARMLTARWRREPPPDTTWRGAGWGPPKKDRTNLKIAVWVVLLSFLLLVAWQQDRVRALLGTDDNGSESATGAAPAPVVIPPAELGATRANPFEGSPAKSYPDNEAGIVLPEAKALGAYGAAEVRRALDLTRTLLIRQNLDRDVLFGATTDPVLKLLDPASLDKKHVADHPLSYATRFDASEVALVEPVVKVTGTMTYDLDENGHLTVHSDYSFVYALTRPDPAANAEVTRSLVRRVQDTLIVKGRDWVPTAAGRLTLGTTFVDTFNSSCTRLDGVIHPHFSDTPDDGSRPSGVPVDPYDRGPLDVGPTAGPDPLPSASAAPGDDCWSMSRI